MTEPYRLTVRDAMVLTIAAATYKYRGARVTDMHTHVGMTEPVFTQRLLWLLEQPDAMRMMPSEVSRLRRLRDARRVVRQAG